MYFGTKQNKLESYALLDQFTEAGGNFIDTANIYAWWVDNGQGGESETILGSWMRTRKNRNEIIIATKVGFGYEDVPRSLSRDTIEQECNKSLKRLGIETIDLFYAHNDERSTPLEETLEAFYRLTKAGKIRQVGASNYLPWRLEESRFLSMRNDWPKYCCIQQRHSYLRKANGTSFDPQITANDELFDYCRNRDITLLAYSVLLSGAYSRKDLSFDSNYLGKDTDNRITVLKKIASDMGMSPNQVILAWMLQSNPQVLPLIAASNHQQMEENLGAININLTDLQMDLLNNAGPNTESK
jgi:aryl-alcohol dehydrogenase-like predicted oxidoreductase